MVARLELNGHNMLTIQHLKEGPFRRESWISPANELHRLKGPALKNDYRESYYVHNRLDRPYWIGPARTERWSTGQIKSLVYQTKGKFHRPREDGPAYINFDRNGKVFIRDIMSMEKP